MSKKHQIDGHHEDTSADNNETLAHLRDALIYERRARRMSLRELSRLVGCSRSALSEFESGSSKTSAIFIFKYAEAVVLKITFAAKSDFRIIVLHSEDLGEGESSSDPGVQ